MPGLFTVVLLLLLTGCASPSRVPLSVNTPSRNAPSISTRPPAATPAEAPENPTVPEPACRQGTGDVLTPLLRIVRYLHTQRIMYNSASLSDCSGMFHRIVQSFQAQCSGYALPHPVRDRTSRQIARWYARQGRFTVVTNPWKQASLIRPGMVMFYGRTGRRYVDLGRPSLIPVTRSIGHLGVVVAVRRDRQGRILGYHLFHGRRPGKPAAITTYHTRNHPTAPFGNGVEQWIGIAPFASMLVPAF